jgi:hypothetical protein
MKAAVAPGGITAKLFHGENDVGVSRTERFEMIQALLYFEATESVT